MKRCIVRFQPQAWVNDYAMNIDGAFDIDVTDRVLEMGRVEALKIKDDSYDSDNLVSGLHDHGGPFYVSCEDAIEAFFD